MKISIWQQFSSNHSARFTVVGKFATVTDAQRAAGELDRILRSILEWYDRPENAEAKDEWQNGGWVEASPQELAIAQQYEIEWNEGSLDWLWLDPDGKLPIKIFDNYVFIGRAESAIAAKPMDALVAKLGGIPMVDGAVNGSMDDVNTTGTITVDLKCKTPDESTAKVIHDAVIEYFETAKADSMRMFDTPWKSYALGISSYSTFHGKVAYQGQALSIDGSFFQIDQGFPALIAYLKDKGCTDIQHEFTEHRETWEDEEDE